MTVPRDCERRYSSSYRHCVLLLLAWPMTRRFNGCIHVTAFPLASEPVSLLAVRSCLFPGSDDPTVKLHASLSSWLFCYQLAAGGRPCTPQQTHLHISAEGNWLSNLPDARPFVISLHAAIVAELPSDEKLQSISCCSPPRAHVWWAPLESVSLWCWDRDCSCTQQLQRGLQWGGGGGLVGVGGGLTNPKPPLTEHVEACLCLRLTGLLFIFAFYISSQSKDNGSVQAILNVICSSRQGSTQKTRGWQGIVRHFFTMFE